MLVYISSGKCYTYIMCCVWLWVSVFLQACVVLWSLNILCVVYFGVLCICMDGYMHELYIPDLRRADVMYRDCLKHVEQYIIKQVSSSWSTFIQLFKKQKWFLIQANQRSSLSLFSCPQFSVFSCFVLEGL